MSTTEETAAPRIIDLGFVEICVPWQIESRFFPSKVGGKPAWLDLKNLPDAEQLACDYCHEPCVFLCQIYAPYEDSSDAFHRAVYVFVCRKPDCCRDNSSGNLRVFRSQLARSNEFYSAEPPEPRQAWCKDATVSKWSRTCQVCGISASNRCSKCKNTDYCCRSHQIWDWKNGHKSSCGAEQTSRPKANRGKFLFPEYEISTEREDFEDQEDDGEELTEEELEKFKKILQSGGVGTLQEEEDVDKDLLAMANGNEDKCFLNFQERISSNRDQILRYSRGGEPLFISSDNQPQAVPNCEECGSERQFEFQIMPQMLVHLKVDDLAKSIDWGILAIYTCKKSCTPKCKYVKEYVWKQDITKDSV